MVEKKPLTEVEPFNFQSEQRVEVHKQQKGSKVCNFYTESNNVIVCLTLFSDHASFGTQ